MEAELSQYQTIEAEQWTHLVKVIGASLSEPHTSRTALQDVCVGLLTYIRTYVHVPNI